MSLEKADNIDASMVLRMLSEYRNPGLARSSKTNIVLDSQDEPSGSDFASLTDVAAEAPAKGRFVDIWA